MKSFLKNLRYAGQYTLLLGTGLWLLTACGREKSSQYQSVDTAMGTVIRQTVYATQDASEIMAGIRREITTLEDEWISRRKKSSQIYQINAQSGSEKGIDVPEYLLQMLENIFQVSEESGGTLDITIGEAVRLWNIDEYAVLDGSGSADVKEVQEFQVPAREALAQALERAGYEKVKTEGEKIYLPQGTTLDLGAVGKGMACDEVLGYLKEQPAVQGAVITIGGSILTYGQKPEGGAWKVGIIDPRDTDGYMGRLVLEGQWCVSTSGDYERYVEKDGVRYHHIIDPSTGYPADAGLISVTILSRDGWLSDALSTACFVLGAEKSVALLEKYDAYAVMVEKDGNIILSPGMEQYFRAE